MAKYTEKETLNILFRDLCKIESRTFFDPQYNNFVLPDSNGTIVSRPTDDDYIKLDFNRFYGGYQMQENGGSRTWIMSEDRYTVTEMIAFIRGYLAAKKP